MGKFWKILLVSLAFLVLVLSAMAFSEVFMTSRETFVVTFCDGGDETCREQNGCYRGQLNIAKTTQTLLEDGWEFRGRLNNVGGICAYVLFTK